VITPDALKERAFQILIKEYLIDVNGYDEMPAGAYDKHLAIDRASLFSFLWATQEETMEKLKGIYKTNLENKILENLDKELRNRGTVDVLKHGIKDYGHMLDIAYFKPPSSLNPKQMALYEANIISVAEELNYEAAKRIDLVIFVNGLPIVAMELKNAFTGQTVKDAQRQFAKDRSGKETLFRGGSRVIVNLAIDTDEVMMATRLNGDGTVFLPFNKGTTGGAGNPVVYEKLRTHYLWEEILTKDSLMDILRNFAHIERKQEKDENGKSVTKEKLIWPRYHQLQVVRRLLETVKEDGPGNKYLIQHSAGSGKTNSITWLAHRLSSLHNDLDKVVFDAIIVITDRKVLNQQLHQAIYAFEHKTGLVSEDFGSSAEFAEAIQKGTKIMISTIQKFPNVLKILKEEAVRGKNYAVIIDEAHSSTSGDNIIALKETLSLDEAAQMAQAEEEKFVDTEDKILAELEYHSDVKNISFFAFTATPKPTTLRMFGRAGEGGKYYPFDLYSMRQAIEEGYILDVLQNFMTYEMYYKVAKTIEEDPLFDKARATKRLVRYVSLHPSAIGQKSEVIIEHFRSATARKIGGKAKAMLITPSRLHAVRYKLAFDKYLKEKGYDDMMTMVAFSGEVNDEGNKYTEPTMNGGISESSLPATFAQDEYKVLIVANKYQTGYDQPLLHTMYVDKKLTGVKAVQTLSRLNRTHPGKVDTFILDFVNKPEDIKIAFEPFYEATVLGEDINPNDVYTLSQKIMATQIVDEKDVSEFADAFYGDASPKATAIMNAAVDRAIDRFKKKNRDEQIEISNLIKKYASIYLLITQVTPFRDVDLHKLHIYLRLMLKKIDLGAGTNVDLNGKVILEYLRLEAGDQSWIMLEACEELKIDIKTGTTKSEEKDPLSEIIRKLNERHGTKFSDNEKLAIAQIQSGLISDKELKVRAQHNSMSDFLIALRNSFMSKAVTEYDKNQEFYGKIFQDENFRESLIEYLLPFTYSSLSG